MRNIYVFSGLKRVFPVDMIDNLLLISLKFDNCFGSDMDVVEDSIAEPVVLNNPSTEHRITSLYSNLRGLTSTKKDLIREESRLDREFMSTECDKTRNDINMISQVLKDSELQKLLLIIIINIAWLVKTGVNVFMLIKPKLLVQCLFLKIGIVWKFLIIWI